METSPFVEHRPPAPGPLGPGPVGTLRPTRSSSARTQDVDVPHDLSLVPTRQLRVLCDQSYRLLDRAAPPLGILERYERLVEEIERREVQAEERTAPVRVRVGFRDNTLFSRFEFFNDGVLVGYVKYGTRGAHTVLVQAVVDPRFDAVEMEPALIRQVLLHTHRRRIAVLPRCPRVQTFLSEFPQYLALLPVDRRGSVRGIVPGVRS